VATLGKAKDAIKDALVFGEGFLGAALGPEVSHVLRNDIRDRRRRGDGPVAALKDFGIELYRSPPRFLFVGGFQGFSVLLATVLKIGVPFPGALKNPYRLAD
jgi:hypothetical protein